MSNLGDLLLKLHEKVDLNLLEEIDLESVNKIIEKYDALNGELLEIQDYNSKLEIENKELKEIIIKILRENNK